MVETVYPLASGDEKTIEKVLFDEHLHYIHMIFPKGDGLPIHNANSNVYMTVLRGTLTIALDDEEARKYGAPIMLAIPHGTKMDVRNTSDSVLELLVVKAPAPTA